MHRLGNIYLILAAVLVLAFPASALASGHGHEPSKPGELDMKSYIFGHIGDSYEWHITSVGEKHVSIPLPCIVFDEGLHVFLSSRMEENGYTLNEDGKLVNASTGERPFDISITKNVFSLILSSILLVTLILLTARWYKRHDAMKEAPRGLPGLMEMLITMVTDDIIKEGVGKEYMKYAPYLLTAFFFIFLNNLIGIVPFFPGGANVTGNIAVTLFLAVCTFLAVNLFGNKHYYKDIFWPEVPTWLKVPLPLMPIIEIIGMFTKPFSLMVRLFANILAGHIMLLGVVAVVFLTAKLGPVLNGSMSFIAVLFGVFMDILELLVAFIQAYVFTMLSSVFIGLSRQEPEHGSEHGQIETTK
ncbi:MAG: F0F1 ATP synthase subunit A [Bacteroidales bacterium]|nr:F0F1 ATP synthase subunit A [Bacteroidales bacterium]